MLLWFLPKAVDAEVLSGHLNKWFVWFDGSGCAIKDSGAKHCGCQMLR